MQNFPIRISDEIRSALDGAVELHILRKQVKIGPPQAGLLEEIRTVTEPMNACLAVGDVATHPVVAATREAYKSCGKDPSRYRPSAEALMRRVASGKGLYSINNVVDLLNLVSIRSGYSIGGFDVSAIEGTPVLGIGREGEPYAAIGRGELNITGLPVLRDDLGAFGTPTSDSERTMVRESTTDFLMVFYRFGDSPGNESAVDDAADLLERFGSSPI